jgi:hypothetical protein
MQVITLYLRERWIDKRLDFTTNESQLPKGLRVPAARQIWTPNTYFVIGRELTRSADRRLVNVESNGLVFHSQM